MKNIVAKTLVMFIIFYGVINCDSFSMHVNYLDYHIDLPANSDTIKENVKKLQAFNSRFCFNDNRKDVALYLKNRLENYGFSVKIDSFYIENLNIEWYKIVDLSGWQYNVIGEKTGLITPNHTVILGAHYDCIASKGDNVQDTNENNPYWNYSPGADDNASGVSGALEVARMFYENGINTDRTLRIEFYAAEEMGLLGSKNIVEKLDSNEISNIKAMINLDMIGYDTTTFADTVSIVTYNDAAFAYRNFVYSLADSAGLVAFFTDKHYNASDSYSYSLVQIPAFFISEHDFTPDYHSPNDVFTTLNYDYMSKITDFTYKMLYYLLGTTDNPVSITDIYNENLLNNDVIARVFDLTGRCLYEKRVGNNLISLDNEKKLPINIDELSVKRGVYILQIEGNNRKISRKIVKI
ncbi:MAG: M20/M25/M40 family metallo-hydrolase [Bacteroidales bacterium]|jgi:hypothetical protein|nr:M20/M25/M40 family metallo-hydrolase [Bacteroidales bacterium]